MIVLQTKRLILRDLEMGDADPLAAIYADYDVMKYIGSGVVLKRENAEKSIKGWEKYQKEKGYANWAVEDKNTGLLIGMCGFSEIPDKTDIEISYLFAKEYWGKGNATEIVSAVMEYGFQVLKLGRIVALVYPENSASIHVIEKMEMHYEKEVEFWGKKLLMYSKINPKTDEQG